MSESDANKPLWKHVDVISKANKGGNHRWRCKFCNLEVNGSYTRVNAHLLHVVGQGVRKCGKINKESQVQLKREVEEAELRIKNSMPPPVPLPSAASSSLGASLSKKRKESFRGPIDKSFNIKERDLLNEEIARMFYSGGLPFNLARNPHYVASYKYATSRNLSGYVPPGYNMLRTTLLQKERANIERLLIPIKDSWKEKGASVVSDGWTDSQRRPIINFMAACESGPMFLRAVNCEGEHKDKFFISNLIRETILSVGASNVVQVITDNAPVCRSAGLIIEMHFPHIFWTPCVVHTLNLALRNICAAKDTDSNAITYGLCNWITDVVGDVMQIKNFIMNHNMRLSMFNEHVELKMLSVAETRFASCIVMLRRFKLIKEGLQKMVICSLWSTYKEDDVGKARFAKEKILDDEWWEKVDYILTFTEPIYDMLRKADTDMPCLHLIYDMWDTMIEKVRAAIYNKEKKNADEESPFYIVVYEILVSRWTKSNTPLHCMAHSLNPRYYSNDWLSASPNRVPPHRDEEVTEMRIKCLEKYFPNVEERRQVNSEFGKFSGAVREFARSDSVSDRALMDPDLWWIVHGSSTPLLQGLALKLLGQPASSSCCERNWSTYSFIHSVKRNKMTPQRAEDLVYVHCNLRLLSRKTPQYSQGENKMWDIAGDAFESLDGVGMLEIANLSLDEPNIEAGILENDLENLDDATMDDLEEV